MAVPAGTGGGMDHGAGSMIGLIEQQGDLSCVPAIGLAHLTKFVLFHPKGASMKGRATNSIVDTGSI